MGRPYHSLEEVSHKPNNPPSKLPTERRNGKAEGGAGNKEPGTIGNTVDDHSVWQEARNNPREAKEAINNLIREAALAVGIDQVPQHFKGMIGGPLTGDTAATDRYEFEDHKQGQLDWRRFLRRYVGQLFQVRPVFNRPPRRFPSLVGVTPGKRRESERPKIMAVIDTSASITPELLRQIDAGNLPDSLDITPSP